MLLDFLFPEDDQHSINKYDPGMWDRPTFDEAISAGSIQSRRPSILEALASYNMRAEDLLGHNVVACFGG